MDGVNSQDSKADNGEDNSQVNKVANKEDGDSKVAKAAGNDPIYTNIDRFSFNTSIIKIIPLAR